MKLYLACAILLIGIALVSGCVSDDSPTKAPSTGDSSGDSGIGAQSSQPQSSSELNLNVGEAATTSKIEVTVFSADKEKSYEYYSTIYKENNTQETSPGNTFLLVDAEIKNVGSDSQYVGTTEFSMSDSEGYSYDPEFIYLGNDGMDAIKQLYTSQKMRGKILFEIPENTEGLKLHYDFGNLYIGTKLATWSIQ